MKPAADKTGHSSEEGITVVQLEEVLTSAEQTRAVWRLDNLVSQF